MTTDKPKLPDNLRTLAVAAQKRLHKRGAVPPIDEVISRPEGKAADYLASPYSEDDWELWAVLLLDAFGTRNYAVAHAFMRQLAAFCPEIFDGGNRRFILDGELFQQALAIVRSVKPQNEAQAAKAVQLVAVYFCSMKVSQNIEGRIGLDARTASSLAQLAKAQVALTDSFEQRNKRRSTRQVIKVEKHVHLHSEKHVHFEGGASGARPALPSANAVGEVLPFPSGEGQARLQDARRR